MPALKVLDLFAGLGGATAAFRDRGHEVVTVDLDSRFKPTICADVLDLSVKALADLGPFDFVWASPPCQCFSVMTISNYWDSRARPKHGKTFRALAIAAWTVDLVRRLEPPAFIVENPVGMLRIQPFMRALQRRTVTYCQYGMPYRKATDLWGGFPPGLRLKSTCAPLDACHDPASRGAKTGLGLREVDEALVEAWRGGSNDHNGNGSNKAWAEANPDKVALRALVPYDLGLQVCLAVEAMAAAGVRRPAQMTLAGAPPAASSSAAGESSVPMPKGR